MQAYDDSYMYRHLQYKLKQEEKQKQLKRIENLVLQEVSNDLFIPIPLTHPTHIEELK